MTHRSRGSGAGPVESRLRPAPRARPRARRRRQARARRDPADASSARCSPSGARRSSHALYERLLEKYTVTIEMPKPPPVAGRSRRRERRAVRRRLVARPCVGLALCGARPRRSPTRPAPASSSCAQTGPRRPTSFLWKKPTGGEVEIQIAPVIPPELPARRPGRAAALAGRGGRARHAHLRGRPRRQDDRDRRARGHDHRRAGAPAPRRRPPGEPPAAPDDAVGDARRRHDRPAERALGYVQLGVQHILLGVDHLLFVLGLMLIVVRPLDAGEDDHVLHRWRTASRSRSRRSATRARRCRRSTPRSRSASSSSAPRSCAPGAARRASRSATPGWWPSPSACCTASASRAASRRWACRRPRSRSRCCSSTWASSSGRSPSCCWWSCSSARSGCWRCAGRGSCERLPGYAVGTLGAYWTIQRTLMLLAEPLR